MSGTAPSPATTGGTNAGIAARLNIRSFVPVPIDLIVYAERLPCHIYVLIQDGKYELYRNQGAALSRRDRDVLLVRGVRCVHVNVSQYPLYCQYLETTLAKVLAAESIVPQVRAQVLYQVADLFVKEMATEFTAVHVKRARRFISLLAAHVLSEPAMQHVMAEVIAHEPHPGSHMVHVAVDALKLGLAMNVSVDQLADMALGAFLHDIAKPPGSPPTPNPEAGAYREHPRTGAEAAKNAGLESEDILAMIAQHHERADGKGYPDGLAAEKIHAWAKACAIIDAFDHLLMDQPATLTSPTAVADALAKLDALAPGNFDPGTLASFKAFKSGVEGVSASKDTLIDKLLEEIKGPAAGCRDRRKDQRLPCRLLVMVRRNNQPGGRDRPPFGAEFLDISRTGARILSPERLISGTEVMIDVPAVPRTARTQPITLRATVVRCQQSRAVNAFDVAAKFTGP